MAKRSLLSSLKFPLIGAAGLGAYIGGANLLEFLLKDFTLSEISGLGLDAVFGLISLVRIVQISSQINKISALKKSLSYHSNPHDLLELKEYGPLSLNRHLFYIGFELAAHVLCLPVFVGEALVVGLTSTTLAATLPVFLAAGYGLYAFMDLVHLVKLLDLYRFEADLEKKKDLQSKMITRFFSMTLLVLGAVCGLIGLGVVVVPGIIPGSTAFLAISIGIFAFRCMNKVSSKSYVRKALSCCKRGFQKMFGLDQDEDELSVSGSKNQPFFNDYSAYNPATVPPDEYAPVFGYEKLSIPGEEDVLRQENYAI